MRALGSPVALGSKGCPCSQPGDTANPDCDRILTVQSSPRSSSPSDWVTVPFELHERKGRDWLTLCESSSVGGERALSYLAKESRRRSAPLPPRAMRVTNAAHTPCWLAGTTASCSWPTLPVINRPTDVILWCTGSNCRARGVVTPSLL